MTEQHALVVGASGDIGKAVVERLLAAGTQVVAHCHQAPQQDLPWAGQVCRLSRVDLTSATGPADLLGSLPSDWDRLDILIHALGGARPYPFAEVSDDEWDLCLTLNLTVVFRVMRAAVPMLARAGGAVINLTSVAALTGGAFGPHYAAAKAGLIGLTRSAARELGPSGIRVNAVAPGPVDSRMTDLLSPGQLAGLLATTALGRTVTPAEVAEVVTWLAGAEAVTGQTVVVDGGRCFV